MPSSSDKTDVAAASTLISSSHLFTAHSSFPFSGPSSVVFFSHYSLVYLVIIICKGSWLEKSTDFFKKPFANPVYWKLTRWMSKISDLSHPAGGKGYSFLFLFIFFQIVKGLPLYIQNISVFPNSKQHFVWLSHLIFSLPLYLPWTSVKPGRKDGLPCNSH